MTESQVFQMMVIGMSTVGAGMPLVYTGMGAKMDYVLAANIMAAPAAVVFAKLLVPELECAAVLTLPAQRAILATTLRISSDYMLLTVMQRMD